MSYYSGYGLGGGVYPFLGGLLGGFLGNALYPSYYDYPPYYYQYPGYHRPYYPSYYSPYYPHYRRRRRYW